MAEQKTKPYKAIAALLVVAVAEALNYGLIPEKWQGYAQVAIAVAVSAGVYTVRNPPKAVQ
jgi:hypothetical protein